MRRGLMACHASDGEYENFMRLIRRRWKFPRDKDLLMDLNMGFKNLDELENLF